MSDRAWDFWLSVMLAGIVAGFLGLVLGHKALGITGLVATCLAVLVFEWNR